MFSLNFFKTANLIQNLMIQDLDPESSFENDAERQTVDTKKGKFKVSPN